MCVCVGEFRKCSVCVWGGGNSESVVWENSESVVWGNSESVVCVCGGWGGGGWGGIQKV